MRNSVLLTLLVGLASAVPRCPHSQLQETILSKEHEESDSTSDLPIVDLDYAKYQATEYNVCLYGTFSDLLQKLTKITV